MKAIKFTVGLMIGLTIGLSLTLWLLNQIWKEVNGSNVFTPPEVTRR